MSTLFHRRVKCIIKRIPKGKVATYGHIATLAGNHRAARQVAWVLHSSSRKDRLPWHRVVNGKRGISLRPSHGYEAQKELLKKEGIEFDENDLIDFQKYLWAPSVRDSSWVSTDQSMQYTKRQGGLRFPFGHL